MEKLYGRKANYVENKMKVQEGWMKWKGLDTVWRRERERALRKGLRLRGRIEGGDQEK